MSTINWTVSHEDHEALVKLVDRAAREYRAAGVDREKQEILMDLTACHANGCPLQLEAMLAADDSNFLHDVAGIARHIDRRTGQLGDGFLPRFAVVQHATK